MIGLIAYEIVVNTKTMGGNITVNGANVSRLTPEKASETLSSAFESKQLTYVENGIRYIPSPLETWVIPWTRRICFPNWNRLWRNTNRTGSFFVEERMMW